ncbi:MAG: DUF262 domain-containing protein [Calothrix sp. MO_167.B42]|nr:DUF262 domain-containing protein [Calothrix sp. MO_167.B42]
MNIEEQIDTLQSEIDQKRQEIRSDSYSMSVGEWISLYQQGEIDIHPEFQRLFRWSDYQKTKLIESILLGIPIPPIFVSQREDGIWDVVDGLQRLSTIYQFIGILKDEDGNLIPPFHLQITEYLPSLTGKIWEDKEHPEGSNKGFTPTQRLLIKRAKIDVNILLKESDPYAKYELFQRLNTGGVIANSQELRNCILVSLNPNLYRWIKQLSKNKNFQNCIALKKKNIDIQDDIDILCRFLVLRNINESMINKINHFDTFLTKKIQEIANNHSYNFQEEEAAFKKTFQLLDECMAGDSFRKYDVKKQKFSGGFILAPFEAIALGIGYNYQQYNPTCQELREKIVELWSNPDYTSAVGRGKDARVRLPKLIPLGRKLFAV